jgi:hypothetical protein
LKPAKQQPLVELEPPTPAERRQTKRRCAGCNRVITGRPNKLYCSKKCKLRNQRGRKKVSKNDTLSGSVLSLVRGSNGDLIARAAQLGYLDGPVYDLTFGRGAWWTRYSPNELFTFVGDFTDTGFVNDSQPIICFDPPYISTGNRATSSVDELYDRYGLGDLKGWRAVRAQMDAGLVECARILKPGGFLLFKCMDYVESGHKVWNTFHFAARGEQLDLKLVDRFHHLTGGGPQTLTNLDGSPREQKHAREVTSMLLVFTK